MPCSSTTSAVNGAAEVSASAKVPRILTCAAEQGRVDRQVCSDREESSEYMRKMDTCILYVYGCMCFIYCIQYIYIYICESHQVYTNITGTNHWGHPPSKFWSCNNKRCSLGNVRVLSHGCTPSRSENKHGVLDTDSDLNVEHGHSHILGRVRYNRA